VHHASTTLRALFATLVTAAAAGSVRAAPSLRSATSPCWGACPSSWRTVSSRRTVRA